MDKEIKSDAIRILNRSLYACILCAFMDIWEELFLKREETNLFLFGVVLAGSILWTYFHTET